MVFVSFQGIYLWTRYFICSTVINIFRKCFQKRKYLCAPLSKNSMHFHACYILATVRERERRFYGSGWTRKPEIRQSKQGDQFGNSFLLWILRNVYFLLSLWCFLWEWKITISLRKKSKNLGLFMCKVLSTLGLTVVVGRGAPGGSLTLEGKKGCLGETRQRAPGIRAIKKGQVTHPSLLHCPPTEQLFVSFKTKQTIGK